MSSTKLKTLLAFVVACFVVSGLSKCDGSASGVDSADNVTTNAETNTGEGSHVVAVGDGTRAVPVSEPNSASTLSAEQVNARIQQYAIDDLTDAREYPSLNRQLGKKGIREAMAGSRAAAYRAAKNPACDSVNASSPSDYPDRKFKDHHEFFTNCDNGKQWKFTASELKDRNGHWYTAANAPAAGISETDRRNAERSAAQASAPGSVQECSEALKNNLKFPASATIHDIAGASMDFNAKDERFVNIALEAKNDYGNELTYTGQCIFHHNGTVTVQFFNR